MQAKTCIIAQKIGTGSDLFLVYNESQGREGEAFSDGLPARNRELILKFTRLFQMLGCGLAHFKHGKGEA